MVELQGVTRTFNLGLETIRAVDDVSLHVSPGEFVAIMGPSGSGKSTLLHLIGGLLSPDSGRVIVGGVEIATLSDSRKSEFRNRSIGFVFQSFHLQPHESVLENVELPLVLAGISRCERQERAQAALADVGLSARQRHRPHQLSGGEMQRVAIARAIVVGPQILLADEPTGNLDKKTGDAVLQLLTRLQAERGMSLLVVTHNERVAGLSRRLLVMEEGRLVHQAS